jgi:hypothetical protein
MKIQYLELIILFTILTIGISGCNPQMETSEEFVDKVLENVKAKNEETLFNKCYVNSKGEIRKMLKEMGGGGNATSEQINQMYEAVQEDRSRILRQFNILGLEETSNIAVDSVIEERKKKQGFGGEIELSNGFRIAEIRAYVSINSNQYVLKLPCIDLNTGNWKLVNHPKIQKVN